MRSDGSFGDIGKDLVDLEDFVKVGLNAVAVFEDFVLVASYFEAFFA